MTWTERAWPVLRRALVVCVVVSLVYALVVTWSDVRRQGVPNWGILGIACGLLVVATACGGQSWSRLFEDGDRRHARVGFIVSQMSKYLPAGGVFQIGTQVSLSARGSISRRTVAGLTAVHLWLTCMVGLMVGAVLMMVTAPSPPVVGLLGVVAFGAACGMHRRLLELGGAIVLRLVPRAPVPERFPAQSQLRSASVWLGASFMLQGGALALLVAQFDPAGEFLEPAGAFAWAWVIGFVAIPVPSGLGVREAVLVGLSASVSSGAIIAASLVQRGLTIVAELIVAGIAVSIDRRRAGVGEST